MSDKNFKIKNGIDANGASSIASSSVSDTTLSINSISGQYGLIQAWNVVGSTVVQVDGNGHFYTLNGRGVFVNSGWIASTRFAVTPWQTSSIGMIIKGLPSQTGDLTQWQNSDGTVLAKIDSSGSITAADLTLSGNLTVNGTTTNLNSTNLIIEDKNIIIADVATPSDTTADGAGITVKGATDKTFNWVQSTKSFTTSDPLIINNTSTTTVPLIAKGYASQTANHFEVQDSAGNKMFVVNPPAGTLQPLEYFFVRPGGTGGTATIGTNSYSFRVVAAGGNSVSFGTPGGGTSLQVVTSDTFNRYKIIGSGTGIAPTFTTDGNDANVNMYVTAKGAGKIGINTTSPTGYVHAVSSSSSTVGLIVEGATGQTSTNIFEVQRAGGGDPSFTVSHNYINLNRNTTAAASLTVYGANSGAVPLYVIGRSSQSVDLQQWQNSAGTVIAKVDNLGVISSSFGLNIGSASFSGVAWNGISNPSSVTTLPTLVIKGIASQTANLQEWQDSAGNLLSAIRNDGVLRVSQIISKENYSSYFSFSSGSPIQVNPLTSGTVGLVVKAVTSQSADLQQWQNSSGTVNARIDAYGTFQNGTAGGYGAWINVQPAQASDKGIIIRGAASQTADLQQWQDSAGTVLARVYNNGVLSAGSLYAAAGDVSVAYGGYFGGGTAGGYIGAAVSVIPWTTAVVGVIVRGRASQTANLQEWQNSSGTMLSKIDKDGIITVPAINVVGQSISSNTTMIAGYRYFVDTSASRTLTLPSSATIGDEIQIFDSTNTAGTNNITINSNNGKIEGVVESYIIDVNGAAIVMTYTGSTYGWKVRM